MPFVKAARSGDVFSDVPIIVDSLLLESLLASSLHLAGASALKAPKAHPIESMNLRLASCTTLAGTSSNLILRQ